MLACQGNSPATGTQWSSRSPLTAHALDSLSLMKVLFINPGRELGGAEQSLLLLLDALRRAGVDPMVATFGDGPFSAALLERQIPVAYVSIPDAVREKSRYSSR